MGGRIDCYIDIASFYSYLGFVHLTNNLEKLEAYGVQVEFHPILLGAVNNKTGNKPPMSVPAKGKYLSRHELPRAVVQFGRPEIRGPKDLMSMAHTILPNRCLHYVKAKYPRDKFHAVLEHFYRSFWTPPNLNLTKPDVLASVLASAPVNFSPGECETILAAAGQQEVKEALTRATNEAVERGAFGAPWLWVTPEGGQGEPFFGSDRFHHVYKVLGLPFQDVKLLPPGAKQKL